MASLWLVLLLFLGAWSGCCHGASVQSVAKMTRSSPVVAVEIDGVARNLILTTGMDAPLGPSIDTTTEEDISLHADIDGILLCSDLSDKTATSPNLEFGRRFHLLLTSMLVVS